MILSWFKRREQIYPQAQTDIQSTSSVHMFDGKQNFWLPDETKYWIAHSDIYPPPEPYISVPTHKRQREDGSWEEYSVCNTYVPSQLYTNCYPISWESACQLNGGEPPETKPFGDKGDQMIIVNDFMRRNYSFKTDKYQTTLLF